MQQDSFGTDTIATALGNGNGTFQAIRTQTGSSVLENLRISDDLETGDLNGDGTPDLLVFNYASNDVSVFLCNPDGSLQPHRRYGIGNTPRHGTLADFDGDGRIDVAAAIGLPPSGLHNAIVTFAMLAARQQPTPTPTPTATGTPTSPTPSCNNTLRYSDSNSEPQPRLARLRLQQQRPALRPRQRRGLLRPQDQGLRRGQSQHRGLGPEWEVGEGRSERFGSGDRSPCPRRMGTRTTLKSRDRELGSFTDYSRLRVKLRRASTPFASAGPLRQIRPLANLLVQSADGLAVRSLFGFAPPVL